MARLPLQSPEQEEHVFQRLLQCQELQGDAHLAAAAATAAGTGSSASSSSSSPSSRQHLQAAAAAYLLLQDLAPGRPGLGPKAQRVSEQLTAAELSQVGTERRAAT
jgi:hypothetical protein